MTKAKDAVTVNVGRCHVPGPVKLTCYVCGNEAKKMPWPGGPFPEGHGIAQISHGKRTDQLPICESCLLAPGSRCTDEVIRKWWKNPDLEIKHGGEATTEQIAAMMEKPDRAEH